MKEKSKPVLATTAKINGNVTIMVSKLDDNIESKIYFFHELGHSLFHSYALSKPGLIYHNDVIFEGEAWLFTINCFVHEYQEKKDELFKILKSVTRFMPEKYRRIYELVLEFFTDNWINLTPEKSTVDLYVAPLIISVNDILIKEIIENPNVLRRIDAFKFEDLLNEIFHGLGYIVENTKRTRDGGIDIIAVKNMDQIPLRFLIECKRYSEEKKVGIYLVRSIFGVKYHIGASKAIIATTSSFTKPAKTFAEAHKWELDLKDFDGLMGWVKKYLEIKSKIS